MPIESYLVHRTYIVDVGKYFGEVGDAWDVVEACQRALGLEAPPAPVLKTPKSAFDPPPPELFDECGPAGRDGNGDCMNPPPKPGAFRTVPLRTWAGFVIPFALPVGP